MYCKHKMLLNLNVKRIISIQSWVLTFCENFKLDNDMRFKFHPTYGNRNNVLKIFIRCKAYTYDTFQYCRVVYLHLIFVKEGMAQLLRKNWCLCCHKSLFFFVFRLHQIKNMIQNMCPMDPIDSNYWHLNKSWESDPVCDNTKINVCSVIQGLENEPFHVINLSFMANNTLYVWKY